ncbi:MAG: RebB family R body protein [Aureispira sp.]
METKNNECADGIAASNLSVLGNAAAMGVGNIMVSQAHSTGLLFMQQVAQQQQNYQIELSNTSKSVYQILNKPLSLKAKIELASLKYANLAD